MTRTAPGYITKYNANSGLYELHYAGANVPRGSKWKDKNGLTIIGFNGEVERTNYATYSQTLSSWSKQDAGDAIDTTTGASFLDGNYILQGLKCDDTAGGHNIYTVLSSPTISNTYCFSLFIKKADTRWVLFYHYNNTDGAVGHYFDLDSLAWGSALGSGWLTKGYIDCGNGIYRIDGTCVINDATAASLNIRPVDTNGNSNFSGGTVGATTVNLWLLGGQAEIGSYPSSYIKTTTAAATRTADTPIRLSAIGNVAAGKGHAMFDFVMKSKPTAARTMMEISDGGSADDRIYLTVDTNGYLNLYSVAASTVYGPVQLATDFCDDKKYRVAPVWESGYLNLFIRDLYTETLYEGTAETTVSIPDDLDRLEYGVTEYGIMTQPMIHGVPLYGAQAVPFNY